MIKYSTTNVTDQRLIYIGEDSNYYAFQQNVEKEIVFVSFDPDTNPITYTEIPVPMNLEFEMAPFEYPIQVLTNMFIFNRHQKLATVMKQASDQMAIKTEAYAEIITVMYKSKQEQEEPKPLGMDVVCDVLDKVIGDYALVQATKPINNLALEILTALVAAGVEFKVSE